MSLLYSLSVLLFGCFVIVCIGWADSMNESYLSSGDYRAAKALQHNPSGLVVTASAPTHPARMYRKATCPHCNSMNYRTIAGYKPKLFQCLDCQQYYNPDYVNPVTVCSWNND